MLMNPAMMSTAPANVNHPNPLFRLLVGFSSPPCDPARRMAYFNSDDGIVLKNVQDVFALWMAPLGGGSINPMIQRWVRESLKEERTACVNRIRGVLAEFGLVFGKSPKVLRAALSDVLEDASNELSTTARLVLQRALDHWRELEARPTEECHEPSKAERPLSASETRGLTVRRGSAASFRRISKQAFAAWSMQATAVATAVLTGAAPPLRRSPRPPAIRRAIEPRSWPRSARASRRPPRRGSSFA